MVMGFQAGVEYKGKIFFSERCGFGLFSYDITTGKIEFCAQFEELDCFALHRKAFLYGNEAWFIPQSGIYITSVNLDDFSMRRFEIPYKKIRSNPVITLLDGIIINDRLVCCPHDIDTLVIIDLKEHRLRAYSDFIDPENESFISVGKRDNHIWFYPLIGDNIYIINPIDGIWERIKRIDRLHEHSAVAVMDKASIYAPGNKKEIIFESRNGINRIPYKGKTRQFKGSYIKGDEVLFFPLEGREFLLFNTVTMKMESVITEEQVVAEDKYILIQIDSADGLFLSSLLTGYVLKIDEEYGIKPYRIETEASIIKKQIESITSDMDKKRIYEVNKKNIFKEDYKHSLKGFLNYVVEG